MTTTTPCCGDGAPRSAAWEEHLADPNLPANLAPLLHGAGFLITSCEVFPLLNTQYQANTYSSMVLPMIANFVVDRQGISKDEAQGWHQEIKQQSAKGAFFFSLNRLKTPRIPS